MFEVTVVKQKLARYTFAQYSTLYLLAAFILLLCNVNAQSLQNTPSELDVQRKARETFYKLDQSNNYSESLSYADMNLLPMGLKQTVSNVAITIAVSDARWESTHTELTVFARVEIPQGGEGKDKFLFFGAQGIKLSHEGDIIGDASLVLMGDYSIPINGGSAALTLKGTFDGNSGRGKELTYVSIDCKGFREMGIAAEVEFPESLLQPVDEKGVVQTGQDDKGKPYRVRAGFKTIVKDWNDFIADVQLPPFQLNGLDGFIFAAQEAVFDFSDYRNAPDIRYPQGYELSYMVPGNPTLWRGVFVRQLSVTLPKQFKTREDSDRRISFIANDMLLDNNGISGTFAAAGILPIDRGTASGWRFSVDAFSMSLEANQLVGAGFSGLIGLPVSEKSNLGYDALITADNEYMLRVKPVDTLSFDVFKGRAELLPNSYVELKVQDGSFKPEALLHGSLGIPIQLDGSGKKLTEFKGIEFRSLRLKTESPKFTAEYFGYKGELKLMNFPISVDRIGFRNTGDEVALIMGIKLTLSDNLFAGNTQLELVAEEHTTASSGDGVSESKWRYKTLRISDVAVKATIAEVMTLNGKLAILNNDPTYGDGYSGSIRLTFDKVAKGLDVQVRAMFGCKDFRYWFVDGLANLPGGGIPVFGPVKLKGFGGGVSQRMKRVGGDPTSAMGTVYAPDGNYGLGVKSIVTFAVGSDKAIDGEASFEIAFNRSGGLNFIGFYGFAKFVGKLPGTDNVQSFVQNKYAKVAALEDKYAGKREALEKLKLYEPNKAASEIFPPSNAPGQDGFAAAVGIQYDFTQNSLHATFDLYVNALGGVVRGVSSGNRAGWAVLHIDPNEWYMHMGTPTDRIGLKMGISVLSVETGAYLMIGHKIPGSPPPPKEVADILGVDMAQLDYMRDLNSLGEGKGFAFGASLKVATGDITFLILYANFQAGLGFDIMLKDYGDAQCKGRSGKIGFDGMFANGQAYCYLQGELGVKVNLRFIKGKFPIIKGAAAALLQAKLPNPAWFRGYLGVRFSVLGGMVSGNCRFKFTIGEECELVIPGGSPVDMPMITDFKPVDNADAVDVFAAPQAVFAMRAGIPFDVQDDDGFHTYRISVNEFSVKDNGQAIPGKLIWTSNNDAVSYYSHEVLPPGKSLKAIIRVGFEEYKSGRWAAVYTGGMLAQEIKEVTFKTGTAPDVIPLTNVEYAYPVVNQKFFLKDETNKGVVQLKRGQSYLFSSEYTYEIAFTKSDGSRQSAPFTYNASTNRIEYTIPSVTTQGIYGFDVLLLNKASTGLETPLTVQTDNIGTEEDEITVTRKNAASVVRSDIGKSLLGYDFSTSRYTTFSQKVKSIQKAGAVAGRVSSDVIDLRYETVNSEPFDLAELTGTEFTGSKPLVELRAILTDDYYLQDIHPPVYKNYPVAGLTVSRDTATLGFPPVKSIFISTEYLTEVENNSLSGLVTQRFPYIYDLPKVYKEDFIELQNKIVNRFLGTPEQSQYSNIINGYYKFIRSGYYKVKLQYVLPDSTKGTSETFDFYNFIQ